MSVALQSYHFSHLVARRSELSTTSLWWVGLLLVVCIPTAFWAFVFIFAANALGIAISATAVIVFCLVIAASSLVGVALLTANRP